MRIFRPSSRAWAGLLLPALLLCGCNKGAKPGPEAKGGPAMNTGAVQRESLTRVQVSPVRQREMVRTLSVTRAIESEFEIDVLPRTSGTVVELLVDEGDPVAAEQVLARLDSRAAEASLRDVRLALEEARNNGPRLALAVREAEEQVQRAKLTHDQAARDYERNQSAGFVSSSDLEKRELSRDQAYRDWQGSALALDKARQEVDNQTEVIARAELAIEKAELELSYFEIRAPFDGVIANRMVGLGAAVGPSQGIFRLTDPTKLRAVLHRPQKELAFYQQAARLQEDAGDTLAIEARPEAYDNLAYAGRIRRVSPVVDAESGSVRVTVDLEQPAAGDSRPPLLPGMMVRLSIVTERHPDALVVEKRALRREGELRFVWVVRGGNAQRVEVEEGLLGDDDVEVLPLGEGPFLTAGETVIVLGGRDLEDGQAVQVVGEDSGAEPAPEAEETGESDSNG
ncbi:MAG: efflux RND transporter periplasmic adaptor subunit [Planctomycetota bacterium]